MKQKREYFELSLIIGIDSAEISGFMPEETAPTKEIMCAKSTVHAKVLQNRTMGQKVDIQPR